MQDKIRPPFVVAFAADMQGCGLHRIQYPLASLVDAGVADGRIDLALWPDHVLAAAAPDVIVVQRRVEDADIEAITRWRAMLPNTLFVYELDDYLGEIPPASFHAGFMPPDVDKKVARGLAVVDRVTTTTDTMAEWLRSLGATDVRVVPNGVLAERIKEREPRQQGKLRIGFAGGMSHSGDLKLIEPAMEEIGDLVEWVFFGTRPDGAKGVKVEFHEGVSPQQYLDVMQKLDVDCMVAPLEDNMFNRCKSNLRLIETGAIGACVIAQDIVPYKTNQPPVFGYASTPEEWTFQIKRFIASGVGERRKYANSLRAWVGRYYVLQRLLGDRMYAWLPSGEKWRPATSMHRDVPFVVSSPEDRDDLIDRMPFLRQGRHDARGLEQAVAEAVRHGSDLLWLRPATSFGDAAWRSMLESVKQSPDIAAVVPVASDGPNSFPKLNNWMPMSASTVAVMSDILNHQMRRRKFNLTIPSGPCILLSAQSLGMLGAPDVAGCDGNEEQAIIEWGARAAMREWKHIQVADAFAASVAPPPQNVQQQTLRLQARGYMDRLRVAPEGFSDQEREEIELTLMGAQWGGPRPGSLGFGVDYASWKALTDAKAVTTALPLNRLGDLLNVQVRVFGEPHERDNSCEWTIWVDDKIARYPHALNVFADICSKASANVQVVYSDHDTLFFDGNISPEFKPDFDLELFLAQDYITPVCAVRSDYPFEDRTALFEHIVNVAIKDGGKAFWHISRALGSMKMEVRPEEMALDALRRQIIIQELLGETAIVSAIKRIPGCLSIVRDWKWRGGDAPLVSIIIPTLGSGRLLQPCLNTISQHTDYPNYEVIVVHNGDKYPEPEMGRAADDPRVRVVRWNGKFNWSAINNWAIRLHSKGRYIVTLNDDVTCGCKQWLDVMLGHAVLPDVGVVGARLLHPMGFIQHAGVVAHRGVAGHMHKGLPNGQLGHLGRAVITHEAAAVTGACMMFARNTFDVVNGFDENMPRNYNDTDFCLRVGRRGLRNVVEMTAELLHPEGASRGDPMSPDSLKLLAKENGQFAKMHSGVDPYWNPNLQLGLVHGGVFIQGLNAEVLQWDDLKPDASKECVLVVNDLPGAKGLSLDLIRNDAIPMAADLSGFTLKMTGPIPQNTKPWDIRDSARASEGLKRLGVDRIVLRSLVGAESAAPPVEALRFFGALDITVEIDSHDTELIAPPVDNNSKTFGYVDRNTWMDAYIGLGGVLAEDQEAAE